MMISDFGKEMSFTNKVPRCECYKKLHLLGVPLFISEENEEYSEHREILPNENAFPLPGFLRINEKVTEYPVVEEHELADVFRQMTDVIPKLADFDLNLVSFWIMDVFIEGLWTAQNAQFPHEHQAATLKWIAYFFNYLQKNNVTRKEMFRHLKEILFMSGWSKLKETFEGLEGEMTEGSFTSEKDETDEEVVGEENLASEGKKIWELPLPPDLEISAEDKNFSNGASSTLTDPIEVRSNKTSTTNIETSEFVSNRNLKNMKVILEILYRIFARLWVFMEIQTAFHSMPFVEQVDLPFDLKVPKPRFKEESFIQLKPDRGGRKLSLINEKFSEETETERQLHKNDYILPLQEAEEAKSYAKKLFGVGESERSVNGNRKGKK